MGQGLFGTDGAPEFLEGLVIDIDRSKRQLMAIEYLSNHDHLTGLYNRRYYDGAKERLDRRNICPCRSSCWISTACV
jgi:hypothetical protein